MTNTDKDTENKFWSSDFTTDNYKRLLILAQKKYKFIQYPKINEEKSFLLWRHDCDYSLNRSLRLAQIENEVGVQSTFFLNPHSEFYNLNEKKQSKIIRDIIDLGHNIGLHFDANYYNVELEDQLDDLVSKEARWLEEWFGQKVEVFSFHNPTKFLLGCENDKYGDLINCYSTFFKENVDYCSDSNGYWRFKRLEDVLTEGVNSRLQVLTHPGWWQEEEMVARDRILRCAEGRSNALMQDYDDLLDMHKRQNVGL